jgi:hypothetical protein
MATVYPLPTSGTGNTSGTPTGLSTTAPVGSIQQNGQGTWINIGNTKNSDGTLTPNWSNDPNAIAQAQQVKNSGTGAASPGINSSASLGITYDQFGAMKDAIANLNKAQQDTINTQGIANQQQIAAQQASGDLDFNKQIQQARQSEGAALGNADVSASAANPTGTEAMQTFSPYSPGGEAQGMPSNSSYAGLKASITNSFTQTIGNLNAAKDAFDMQSAANQTTAAAQTESNALTAASASIQNQLTIMDNMVSMAQNSQNLQMQEETNSQNFQIQKANLQLQLQNNQQTQATGMMNTLLSQFGNTGAEGGWNALSPATQNTMAQLAASIPGMSIGAIQDMVNKKTATMSFSISDAFGGTTIIGQDSAGSVVKKQYIPSSQPPTSPIVQTAALEYSYGQGSAPFGFKVFDSSTIPSNLKTLASSSLTGIGYSPLPTTAMTNFSHVTDALVQIGTAGDILSNNIDLAKNSKELASNYIGRTFDQIFQVTDKGNSGQQQSDLASISTLNANLISAIQAVPLSSGGFALRAILASMGGTFITKDTTLETMEQRLGILEKGAFGAGFAVTGQDPQHYGFGSLSQTNVSGTSGSFPTTGNSSDTTNNGSTDSGLTWIITPNK